MMVNKDVCHLFMCLHSISSLMKYPKFLVQFVSRSFVLLLLGCMNSHILKIRHLSCMCITNILFQFVSCLLISQCFFQTTELFFFFTKSNLSVVSFTALFSMFYLRDLCLGHEDFLPLFLPKFII